MVRTMEIAIDRSGRVVIPRALREAAGLEPGVPLLAWFEDGAVHLGPAPRAVRLVRDGDLLVAVPEEQSASLTNDTVRETLDRVREGR